MNLAAFNQGLPSTVPSPRSQRGRGSLGDREQLRAAAERFVRIKLSEQEPQFALALNANNVVYVSTVRVVAPEVPGGYHLAEGQLSREPFEMRKFVEPDVRESRNADQLAKNAGVIALLEEWLREAEQGVDPKEKREWEETKSLLDANRSSQRKLFP